jgi:hypothetical protein
MFKPKVEFRVEAGGSLAKTEGNARRKYDNVTKARLCSVNMIA